MKKLKKLSRKERINHFLNEAKYYNNAGQYKKAVENINLAYSVWEGYNDWKSNKAQKMLDKIIDAREIVVHNYMIREEISFRSLIDG